ncbi:NADP-dependent oxidoreductase [Actinokineospora sp. HUAS TT18]|uniref:NADP-dependent oxidoreductase n=1 Tax=Actinokineospora sp. HUAS TT18 TaxID=3447451 RepID=UPI003F52304E
MATVIRFSEFGGPEVLTAHEVDDPVPGPGEARVRVRAAGVNPVDARIRRGQLTAVVEVRFPQGLGNEFAGVVDRVGPGVAFREGDEVLGFTNARAYTDVLTVPADQLIAKPRGLAWDVAGSLSAVSQTAYNALRHLRVGEGDTVLIHAAAGGVGTIATQLAVLWGARVIGTASERNHAYLRSLGAIPVAYGDGLAERVRALGPVDAALDAVGGPALDVSLGVVADRTRIGTIADHARGRALGVPPMTWTRSTETLRLLAALHADRTLTMPVASYALANVVAAHRELDAGHVRGKLVLTPGTRK